MEDLLAELTYLRPYTQSRKDALGGPSGSSGMFNQYFLFASGIVPKAGLGWLEEQFDKALANFVFWKFRKSFDLNKIFEANGGFGLVGPLVYSAALSGVSYLEIKRNEAGAIVLTPFSATQAYGVLSSQGLIRKGVSVLEEDEEGIQRVKFYDNETRTANVVVGDTLYPESDVYLAHLPFRPTLDNPYGRSMISDTAIQLSQGANIAMDSLRALTEDLSNNTRLLLGTDQTVTERFAEGDSDDKIVSKRFQAISAGDNAKTPTVANPHHTDPSYAIKSMKAYEEEVSTCFHVYQKEPGYVRKELESAFKDLGAQIIAVRDRTEIARALLGRDTVVWYPTNVDIGSVGDALFKVNQIYPGYFGVDQINELLGIEGEPPASPSARAIEILSEKLLESAAQSGTLEAAIAEEEIDTEELLS